MKTCWTPQDIAQAEARIRYKNRVAEHYKKVTYYVKNYYFTEPWKGLGSLIMEFVDLIHIAIERGYRDFLCEYGNDLWGSLVCLMDKGIETGIDDESYTNAFDALMELNRDVTRNVE